MVANNSSCTPPSVDQFPLDIFSDYARQHGAIIIHLLVALYTFAGLAIVCDKYFVASLQKICEYFHLSEDVAGATFMAAGTSGPKLATTIIGVFVAQDDIGLSAMVGSAVYNVLFIVGLCGITASATLALNWWPIARDVLFYTISILLMVGFISDGSIYWYEALVMIVAYAAYIVAMAFNARLEQYFKRLVAGFGNNNSTDSLPLKPLLSSSSELAADATDSETPERHSHSLTDSQPSPANNSLGYSAVADEPDPGAMDAPRSLCERLERPEKDEACYEQLWWLLMLPLRFAFALTIPDSSGPVHTHCCRFVFLATFGLSVIWIGALLYVLVWMLTIAGYTFYIPETVMGMTVLAFGVSVPDALASYFACKQGRADMAMSNAVGSNTFEILVCLGVPWLLHSAIYATAGPVRVFSRVLMDALSWSTSTPRESFRHDLQQSKKVMLLSKVLGESSARLDLSYPLSCQAYAALTLLANVLVYVVTLAVCRWRLGRCLGWVFMLLYFTFISLACLYELNVFGHLNDAPCPSRLYTH